ELDGDDALVVRRGVVEIEDAVLRELRVRENVQEALLRGKAAATHGDGAGVYELAFRRSHAYAAALLRDDHAAIGCEGCRGRLVHAGDELIIDVEERARLAGSQRVGEGRHRHEQAQEHR